MDRLKEIEKRLAEIRGLLTKGEGNVDELEKEIKELQEERKELEAAEKRKTLADQLNDGSTEGRAIDKPEMDLPKENGAEKRGKALKENRSVTVGASSVILPQHQATDINPTFNEVSSLIDRVNIKPLIGGESFKQAYIKGYGDGDYTAEGADYAGAEPVFGYADINKTKVTAYAEDTEELAKLPAADYDQEVMKGISIASRKKITREILVGDGATGHFVGIFSDKATAIAPDTDKELSKIDETTLDEIVYSYGGDEDVEDVAVLILNKMDLKAFATLRNPDGKKVYDVKPNGNVGTIDGVPYIINSACKSIAKATAGQYCMAYGPLSNYTMAIFSDLDVQRSTDYKFKQGMIAHKGSVFAGGNVTSYNGFLRIKKGTAV
jgi:HK97 family phage major capsid protein